MHARDREAVVEILAEPPAVDLDAEIAIRGGDHPQIDLEGLGTTDAANFLALEHAEQLRLHSERQLTDLVEEHRAAVGALERACVRVRGAGEGAALVAEQLALDQVRRDRAAIEHHERALLARRVIVQRLGDQLLADAGLARDEHGGIALRELLEPREHLAHLDRAADHRAEAVGIRELDLDGVPERVELQSRATERDLRPGLDIDVVDPQPRDVGPVRGIEVAQAVAPVIEADLAVQPRHLGIRELDVVPAPRAHPDHRGFDVSHQSRVCPTHDLHAAPAQSRGSRTTADIRDPCARAQVVDRHVAGTLP